MAVKSVIEVDINDESFKKFKSMFDEYVSAIDEAKDKSSELNSETGSWQERLISVLDTIAAQLSTLKEISEQVDKINTGTDESDATLQRSQARWESISKSAKHVASSVYSTTTSLLRWASLGTIFSGLVGTGSLFGLDRIANSVSYGRQSALGLGIGYGEQAAFGSQFSRLVNPQELLSFVSRGLGGIGAERGTLAALLGENRLGGDTGEVSVSLLKKLKQVADATPTNELQNALQARGLEGAVSLEEFRKIKATGPEEFARLIAGYEANKSRFGLDEKTLRSEQELATSFEVAGRAIETKFISALGGINGPLSHLLNSFSQAAEIFLGSKELKRWLDELGVGIKSLAEYIGTDEFRDNVRSFIAGVGKLAEALVWLGGKVPAFVNDPHGTSLVGPQSLHSLVGEIIDAHQTGDATHEREARRRLASQFPEAVAGYGAEDPEWLKTFNTDNGLLDLVRQLEGSGDKAVSPKGAVGRYQIMPGTARQYGYNPSLLKYPEYNQHVAEAILADLQQRYKGNVAEELVAYNAGPGVADKFKKSGDNPNVLPAETRRYLEHALAIANKGSGGVKVVIQNNTGGNANVTVAQLPQ